MGNLNGRTPMRSGNWGIENRACLHDNVQVVVQAQNAGGALAGVLATLGERGAARESVDGLRGRLLHARLQQAFHSRRLSPLQGPPQKHVMSSPHYVLAVLGICSSK